MEVLQVGVLGSRRARWDEYGWGPDTETGWASGDDPIVDREERREKGARGRSPPHIFVGPAMAIHRFECLLGSRSGRIVWVQSQSVSTAMSRATLVCPSVGRAAWSLHGCTPLSMQRPHEFGDLHGKQSPMHEATSPACSHCGQWVTESHVCSIRPSAVTSADSVVPRELAHAHLIVGAWSHCWCFHAGVVPSFTLKAAAAAVAAAVNIGTRLLVYYLLPAMTL